MKILLTGLPRSGKTTLLEKVIEGVSDKNGFITKEIRKEGERTGFELVSSAGHKAVLASTSSKSRHRVSRYGVEVDSLKSFLDAQPEPRSGQLLYIDEIGEMELFLPEFKDFTSQWLSLSNDFVGTISQVYEDEFTKEIKSRNDISIVEVTESNRDELLSQVLLRLDS